MSLVDDVNSLVKTKKIKQGLSDLPTQKDVDSVKGVASDDEVAAVMLKPPLTLDILTYDDTKDVIIEDTSAVQHTLKTAATALITDADGKELAIDTITFATPP